MRMTLLPAMVRSHWLGFALFVPFLMMLCIHEALGLSNAMLSAGNRFDQTYNLFMVIAFYAAVVGFVAHAAYLSDRGLVWLGLKIVLLAIFWIALLWWYESRVSKPIRAQPIGPPVSLPQ